MSLAGEGCIFALGNPLLDISATVTDEFLNKYELEANNAILCDDKREPMYAEMERDFTVSYIPGGATLNSVRYAQWLVGGVAGKHATTYVGCVGKDARGDKLIALCEEDGVHTPLMRTEKASTGTCAVCVVGHDRSLVANLAAANEYDKSAHLESPEITRLLNKAHVIYSSGFPLTVTPDGLLWLGQYAAKENKVFCTNLSAPFICQFFKDPLMAIILYTDYLFGNESEAAEFATHNGGPTSGDVREIACWASELKKANQARQRYVIFTQGLEPTIVAAGGKVILEVPVEKLSPELIEDTNSAGDSFVGGFLAGLIRDLPLEKSIKLGQSAAKYCIQKPGSTFVANDAAKVLKEAGVAGN